MTQTESETLKALASLPVSRFISEASWDTIERYIHGGHIGQRTRKFKEFLNALDWLPLSDIYPNPLNDMARSEAWKILADIQSYLDKKQSLRQSQKEKRDSYRLKVFEYYRERIHPEDKVLLEGLRDYELEKIGKDINWRHYFWFTSFKQIDSFCDQTPLERQELIQQFKKDVEAHLRNTQRIENGTYAEFYWGQSSSEKSVDSFEDWLNQQSAEFLNAQRSHARPHVQASALPAHIEDAYTRMKLPTSASLKEIRQQFRQLTLRVHPDMPGGDGETMKSLLYAYTTLKTYWAKMPQSSSQ